MVPISAVVFAGGAQNRIDQIRRGGLAVGAGDAGQSQTLVRPAVEIARGQRQRLAAVLHFDPARGAEIRRARADSLTTAIAPRATASCANWRPSARLPGNAKNRNPGSTRRESYSSPVTSVVGKLRRKRLAQLHAREYFA